VALHMSNIHSSIYSPSPRSRSFWPRSLLYWYVLWTRSKLLLLQRMLMLLLLWCSVRIPFLRSMLVRCQEYGSYGPITVPKSQSSWCITFFFSRWCMSHLSGMSSTLTPTVQLFLDNEGLLNYIVQCLRHQDPHFCINVEVEPEHKLFNL